MSQSFAHLLKERMSAAGKSPEDLAQTVDLSGAYIEGLLDGSVPPPRSSRTDIYDKLTKTLKMGRKQLADAADAERAGENGAAASPKVTAALMDLCVPETAAILKDKSNRKLLPETLQRLLDLMQAAVVRMLGDTVSVRLMAGRHGLSYPEQRAVIMQFLDTSPATLTVEQVAEFIRPRLSHWDYDFENGVLRIVMRGQESREQHRRRPSSRRTV